MAGLCVTVVALSTHCIPDLDALEARWDAGGGGGMGSTAAGTGGATFTTSSGMASSSTSGTTSDAASSTTTSSSSATASSSSSSSGVVFTPISYTFEAGTNGFTVPYAVPSDWMTSIVPMVSDGNLVTTIPFTSSDGGSVQQEIQIARDLGAANWTGAKGLEMDLMLEQTGTSSMGQYEGFIQSGPNWGSWLSIGYTSLTNAPAGMFALKTQFSSGSTGSVVLASVQRVGIQVKNGNGSSATDTAVKVTIVAVKVY